MNNTTETPTATHTGPEPVRNADGSLQQFMPKVGGRPFRCRCGVNVFHKPDRTQPRIFRCNGCGTDYEAG
jgi:hypothetical protein